MHIKGLNTLVKYLPELNSIGGILKFAGVAFGSFSLTTLYFLVSDQIPTWTLDSQILIFALGFLIVHRAFTQKEFLIEKYKGDAYRRAALRFILPGVSILFAAIAHVAYMDDGAHMKLTQGIFPFILHLLGGYWVLIGAALWLRSVFTFGLDNITFLYLYYPNDGTMVDSSIYKILRHPVYAGAMRFSIGLALLNGGIFALSFIPFLPLIFFGWVRLVEEKELMARFPGYAEYRKQTPVFWVKPRDIPLFFKFIFLGKA